MSILILSTLLALSPVIIGDEPEAPAAEQGLPWVMDIAKAKEMARLEGKDILINFTGSDWCGWCKRLDEEVFVHSIFNENAGKQYVYLYLDFPRSEEAKAKVIDEALNMEARVAMGVDGFPTIILADAELRPYARTGYQAGGPEKYLEHIAELRTGGDKIKALLSAEEADQAKMLEGAFEVLVSQELLGHPAFSKFLDMAEKSENPELAKKVKAHRNNAALKALLNTEEPDYKALVGFLKEHPDMQGPEVLNALWFSQDWLAKQGEKDDAKAFLQRMLKDPLVSGNERGKKMIEDALHGIDHDAGDGHDHDGDGVPDH